MTKLIDLSHTIEDGMITYKGLPAPLICDFLSREESKGHYAEGTEFQIGKIEMVGNTGTYLDSPFHRYADGKDLSDLDLESVAALDGIKISIPETVTEIDHTFFEGLDLKNKVALVHTNWSRHWNTDQYFEDHPHLTKSAAEYLKNSGVSLVGIDSYNIDGIRTNVRPVHTILLGSEILIVEHMNNLAALPDSGFKFYAVPVKIKGFGTFPVRAFVEVGHNT